MKNFEELTIEEVFTYAIGNSLIDANSDLKDWMEHPQALKDAVKPFYNHELAGDLLKTVATSCQEGYDGSWDCSTDEGREGFLAMEELVNRALDLLQIK